MPTLYVFRHAKSSWADTGLRDFDRPLANRGLKAAPRMGQHMAQAGVRPDFILCSTSRRTRETLGLILPFLSGESRVLMEDGIYKTPDGAAMMDRLRRIPNSISRVMIIGHNPVMHDLSLSLSGTSADSDRLEALRLKFPTAGLATIDLGGTPWVALQPDCGTLADFAVPREMES